MGTPLTGDRPDPSRGLAFMGFRQNLFNFWRDLFSHKRQYGELEEELQFHLEAQISEFEKRGIPRNEAERLARLKLGGITQVKEEVRSQNHFFWLESLYRDARFGIRALRKSPGFTVVAFLSLALSIGACTALFSLLYGILLRPLPYPHPDRLVEIHGVNRVMGIEEGGVSARNVQDWRTDTRALDGIAAFYTMGRTLSGNGESEVVLATQVGTDFFKVFATKPLLGRTFTKAESEQAYYNSTNAITAADPVVVLSHDLWVRRFGADQNVIGRSIVLDRRYWKIVGVMPQQFAFPEARSELWLPWSVRAGHPRDQHFARCVARMTSGFTAHQAEVDLNTIAHKLAQLYPETNTNWTTRVTPLKKSMTHGISRVLWLLLAAVCLVLAIACANIAVLHLSRTAARIQESYIRLALGAGRSRLIRQFLVESVLLAVAGAAAGLLFAYFGIEWLRRIEPALPRIREISIDPAVFGWSVLLTVCCTVLFGLGPALVGVGSARASLTAADGLRTTVHAAGQRFRNALVVIEIALAMVLLSSAAMLTRSFSRLQAVNPGFNPSNVLVAPVFLDTQKYGSGERVRAYYKNLFDQLQELPDVEAVGASTALPASPLGADFKRPVWDSTAPAVDSSKHFADVRMITPEYFKVMGITLLRGRGFSHHDSPDAPKVILVNDVLSRKMWGQQNPVGKQLVVDYSSSGTYAYEIVGVVNNVRFHGLRNAPRPEIYFPHAQRSYLILNVAIRTARDPRLLAPAVRTVLKNVDPLQPAHSLTALQDLVDATVVRDRYSMTLVTCFAGVAFTLALLGIYGVLAYYVRQRIREIGIRMALGARQEEIIRWIATHGLRLLLTGLAVGAVAAVLFARLLSGLLFEITPLDLPSYLAAIGALLITAIAATWIPARRASRLNPTIALRYE